MHLQALIFIYFFHFCRVDDGDAAPDSAWTSHSGGNGVSKDALVAINCRLSGRRDEQGEKGRAET